jgi:ankyrin repeat protein
MGNCCYDSDESNLGMEWMSMDEAYRQLEFEKNQKEQFRLDNTPVGLAKNGKDHELSQLLTTNPERVDECDLNGCTPLFWACVKGNKTTAVILLSFGADIESYDKNNSSCFLQACYHGHLALVELLCSHSVDLNHEDDEGDSAIIKSSMNQHNQIVKYLLKNGADINKTNKKKLSARYYLHDIIS